MVLMEMEETLKHALVFLTLVSGTFTTVVGTGAISIWLNSTDPGFLDPSFLAGLGLIFLGIGLIAVGGATFLNEE